MLRSFIKFNEGVRGFGYELLEKYPNIKRIRLKNDYKLTDLDAFKFMVSKLNELKYLSEVQIISESPLEQDNKTNWTHELKVRPDLKKIRFVSRITTKNEMSEQILNSFKRTQTISMPNGQSINYMNVLSSLDGDTLNHLPDIDSWQCIGLSYKPDTQKLQANLLMLIENTVFNQLQFLHIQDSFLSSIEPISRLEAPALKKLFLSRNYITEIKSICKIMSDKLESIAISDNFINDWSPLASILNLSKLASINLEGKQYWPTTQTRNQAQSLSFFAKILLRAGKLSFVRAQSKERIKQNTIKEKMTKINIKYCN